MVLLITDQAFVKWKPRDPENHQSAYVIITIDRTDLPSLVKYPKTTVLAEAELRTLV